MRRTIRRVLGLIVPVLGISVSMSLAQPAPGLLDPPVNRADADDYSALIIQGREQDTLFFTSSRYVRGFAMERIQSRIFYATRPPALRSGPLSAGWKWGVDSLYPTLRIYTQGAIVVLPDRYIFAASRNLGDTIRKDLDGSPLLDIWQVERGSGAIPTPLENVNDPDAWDSQPSVSPDGRTLFFVSARKGGRGKADIWYARMDAGGRWSAPQPAPNINTSGDEYSPFMGADGYFYYSSEGDSSKAGGRPHGKDIFRARVGWNGDRLVLRDAMNLDTALRRDMERLHASMPPGFHINSEADDAFPWLTPDGRGIFIASKRNGGYGRYDIYAFEFPRAPIVLHAWVMEQLRDQDGRDLGKPRPIRLPISVTDSATGRTIPPASDGIWWLDAGRDYRVACAVPSLDTCADLSFDGESTITVGTGGVAPGDTIARSFLVARRRITIPPIVFQSSDTLPYFITGYWYPNTSGNLREFRNRAAGGFFKRSGYVDSTGHPYQEIARRIDSMFETRLYGPLEAMLPRFFARCGDTLTLLVEIRGYTDRRGLSGLDDYPDERVVVGVDMHGDSVVIPTGLPMRSDAWRQNVDDPHSPLLRLRESGQHGNILLSKLRAFFTFRTLSDSMKRRSPLFRRLCDEGRVKLDAEGLGYFRSDGPRDDPMSRRIEIRLTALSPSDLQDNTPGPRSHVDTAMRMPADTSTSPPVVRAEDEHEGRRSSGNVLPRCDDFVIQYCSLSNQEEADEMLRKLSDAGIADPYVEIFEEHGIVHYRVRAGCYPTPEAAYDQLDAVGQLPSNAEVPSRPIVVRRVGPALNESH